eukprot:gene7232-8407_t
MLESKLIQCHYTVVNGEFSWRDTLQNAWSFIQEIVSLTLLSNCRVIIGKFGTMSREEYDEWQRCLPTNDATPIDYIIFLNLTMHPYLQVFSSEFPSDPTISKSPENENLILPVLPLKGQSFAVYPNTPFIDSHHLASVIPQCTSLTITSFLSTTQTSSFENRKEWPLVYMCPLCAWLDKRLMSFGLLLLTARDFLGVLLVIGLALMKSF